MKEISFCFKLDLIQNLNFVKFLIINKIKIKYFKNIIRIKKFI